MPSNMCVCSVAQSCRTLQTWLTARQAPLCIGQGYWNGLTFSSLRTSLAPGSDPHLLQVMVGWQVDSLLLLQGPQTSEMLSYW